MRLFHGGSPDEIVLWLKWKTYSEFAGKKTSEVSTTTLESSTRKTTPHLVEYLITGG